MLPSKTQLFYPGPSYHTAHRFSMGKQWIGSIVPGARRRESLAFYTWARSLKLSALSSQSPPPGSLVPAT